MTPPTLPLLLAAAVLPGGPFEVNGLSGPLAGHPREIVVSPDGERVVYLADATEPNLVELFSVRIDGRGNPVELSAVPSTGDVVELLVDSTSSRVVYRADQDDENVYDLYSAPITGSAPATRLTEDLVGFPLVDPVWGPLNTPGTYFPRLTPDGSRVLFLARRASDTTFRLFSAPLDGSAAMIPLSDGPTLDSALRVPFAITSDGARVVYLAPTPGGEQGVWVAQTDASDTAVLVSVHPTGHVGSVKDVEIAADGSFVVYRGDLETDEVEELFLRPLDLETAQVKLNGPLVAGGDVDDANDTFQLINHAFVISPDGTRVVYRADQDEDDEFELYSVPADGSRLSVKLNTPFANIFEPFQGTHLMPPFRVSPDSTTVVYAAKQDSTARELYSVPIDGSGPPVRLHPPRSYTLTSYTIDPTSGFVASYWALGGNNGDVDVARIDGSLYTGDLAGPLQVTGFVGTESYFELTTGERYVVLGARTAFDTPRELYRVPVDGSRPPRLISGPQVGSSGISDFVVASDGRYVAYRGGDAIDGDALFSARITPPRPGRPVEVTRPD